MPEKAFSITLPSDLADRIDTKVRSGAFGSVEDVILAGIEQILDEHTTLHHWLHKDVVAGHAEYLADPSRALEAKDLLFRLKNDRA